MPLPSAVSRTLYAAYARASPWYRAGRLGAWRRFFGASELWSDGELRAFQTSALRTLLSYAERTRFYPEHLSHAGLSSQTLRDVSELARLPVLTKAHVNRDPEALHVPGAPPFRAGATSGTTGQPMRVRTTAEMDAAARAARWRMLSWYGVPFGARTLSFKGGNQKRDRVLAVTWSLASAALGQTLRDAYRHSIDASVDAVFRLRPEVIFGYPSVIAELVTAAERSGRELCRSGVRLVVVGGESVPEAARVVIAKGFGARVVSLYGSHEGHYMAMECPHGSLHVQETVLAEVVSDDGSPLPPGESGEIVITPLLGYAMPLLRYQLGDRGHLLSDRCPCGRTAPALSLDLCRTTEMVDLGDGRRINSQLFQPMIHNAFGLRFGVDPEAYRVVHVGPRSFEFQLVLRGGRSLPEGAGEFVEGLVRSALGQGIEVSVLGARGLVPDESGKRRTFIPRAEAARFRMGPPLG